jgi:hypothetical protein
MRETFDRWFPWATLFVFLVALLWFFSYASYLVVSLVFGLKLGWSVAAFSPWAFLVFSWKASSVLALWAVSAMVLSDRLRWRLPWLVAFALGGSFCLAFLVAWFVGSADRLIFIGL